MINKCKKASWQALTPSLTQANAYLIFNFHLTGHWSVWSLFACYFTICITFSFIQRIFGRIFSLVWFILIFSCSSVNSPSPFCDESANSIPIGRLENRDSHYILNVCPCVCLSVHICDILFLLHLSLII